MMPEFDSRKLPDQKIQMLQVETRTETLGLPNFLFVPGGGHIELRPDATLQHTGQDQGLAIQQIESSPNVVNHLCTYSYPKSSQPPWGCGYAGTTNSSNVRNSCKTGSELRSISSMVPKKIAFPALRNTTRSASFFASRMSWVTTMLVR